MRKLGKFWTDGDLLDRVVVSFLVWTPACSIVGLTLHNLAVIGLGLLIIPIGAVWTVREQRRIRVVYGKLERWHKVDTLSQLSPADQEEWKIAIAEHVLRVKQ